MTEMGSQLMTKFVFKIIEQGSTNSCTARVLQSQTIMEEMMMMDMAVGRVVKSTHQLTSRFNPNSHGSFIRIAIIILKIFQRNLVTFPNLI